MLCGAIGVENRQRQSRVGKSLILSVEVLQSSGMSQPEDVLQLGSSTEKEKSQQQHLTLFQKDCTSPGFAKHEQHARFAERARPIL